MTRSEGRKGRRLSPEDRALWDGVTRSIRPLRKRAQTVATAETEPIPKRTEASRRKTAAAASPSAPRSAPQEASPAVSTLDRRTRQKIARGSSAIDARLDLHGYTQAEAHDVLLNFLRRTQARGGRVVLVITGKGRRGENDRGVLKRAVPMWLSLPEFRTMVIGFDHAAITHGGEGALYVRLRKARD